MSCDTESINSIPNSEEESNSKIKKSQLPILKKKYKRIKKTPLKNSTDSTFSSDTVVLIKKLPLKIQISSCSEKNTIELKVTN